MKKSLALPNFLKQKHFSKTETFNPIQFNPTLQPKTTFISNLFERFKYTRFVSSVWTTEWRDNLRTRVGMKEERKRERDYLFIIHVVTLLKTLSNPKIHTYDDYILEFHLVNTYTHTFHFISHSSSFSCFSALPIVVNNTH